MHQPHTSASPLADTLAHGRAVISSATAKQAVLDELIALLADAPEVGDAAALRRAVAERESLMSTGIGLGIAVPHVRIDSVSDLVMAVALCPDGIRDYESLDGAPVRIVFLIAAHSHQHAPYLRLLAQVGRSLRSAEAREHVLACSSAEEALRRLMELG